MDNLFAKLDTIPNSQLRLLRLLMLEADWPNEQISPLERDAPHHFSLSQLEGKFPSVTDDWGIIFREKLKIDRETEVFPLFTEIGTDVAVCKTRIRLISCETGAELGTLLRRVCPVKLEPGEYIIMGEVESTEDQVQGSWKLQLIASPICSNLIDPREVTFVAKNETGFYMPPTPATYEPGLLFRYFITLNTRHGYFF